MIVAIWITIPFFLSLPLWLPGFIAQLRTAIFVRINGNEGLAVPGPQFGKQEFRELYRHPHSGGRSQGAKLSDLFWYWLSPGAQYHQEHIENGPVYDEVASCTEKILSVPKREIERVIAKSYREVLKVNSLRLSVSRLRDLLMPLYADFYYQIVFQQDCPSAARNLIIDNARDVADALKHTKLRNMKKRLALTKFLERKIERGEVPHRLPGCFDTREKAYYLQGVYFNTAIVQMSEASAHLFLSLAKHPKVQEQVFERREDASYLVNVIYESFRVYPLFGIAHRIVLEDIALAQDKLIRKGSVLCFDYKKFHEANEKEGALFDPERWERDPGLKKKALPFGMVGNRPCPAKAVAMISLLEVLRLWVSDFRFESWAEHQRNLANRGPCLIVSRSVKLNKFSRLFFLSRLFLNDEVEKVTRSLRQLVFGTWMVWDAHQKKLCTNYFKRHDPPSGIQASLGRTCHA